MSLFLFLLLMLEDPSQVKVIKEFEQPLDVSDESLNFPYSFAFSSDGRLFIVDRWRSRLLVWGKDGHFIGGYCDQGKGPGQIYFPMKIAIDEKYIYIWEPLRRVSVFDLNIKFIRQIKIPEFQPRVFVPLKENLFLMGFKGSKKKEGPIMGFALVKEGEKPVYLKYWEDNTIISVSAKKTEMKAFGPDIDVQKDDKGNSYFGFSQNNTLYQVNKEGEIVGEKHYKIPRQKPSDADFEMYQTLTFPRADGKRFEVSKNPKVKINYDEDKAFYSHFLIKGDKVIFVQTPFGGKVGWGNGFSQASYFIHDFKTGALLSKGSYKFREDSQVLYRNGRIIGLLISDEEDFEVRELSIQGL